MTTSSSSRSGKTESKQLTWWWLGFTTLLIAAIVGWLLLDRDIYLSDDGYELSKSLYAACNLADVRRLDAVENALKTRTLTAEENSLLLTILAMAREGDWKAAEAKARVLLESQATQ